MARAQIRQLTVLWPMLTMHLAIGVFFVCLAVMFAASVGWFGGFSWLLLWPTLSLILVGSGYLGLGPGVTGKRADGTLAWHNALPIMPYLGVATFAWYAVRVLGEEDPHHEVARGLFLGRRVHHWELPARVSLVIDMTAEFVEPVEVRTGRKYLCLPTLDGSVPEVGLLAEMVREAALTTGNVFVHCAAGYGRSAMALAVLMVVRGDAADVDEAVRMMRAVRPRVRLRTTQRRVAEQAAALLLAERNAA